MRDFQSAAMLPEQARARANISEANLGMVKAGLRALEQCRANGRALAENADANIVYEVYEAMRAEAARQSLVD